MLPRLSRVPEPARCRDRTSAIVWQRMSSISSTEIGGGMNADSTAASRSSFSAKSAREALVNCAADSRYLKNHFESYLEVGDIITHSAQNCFVKKIGNGLWRRFSHFRGFVRSIYFRQRRLVKCKTWFSFMIMSGLHEGPWQ
jgi:hypothetical protein